MNENYSYSDKKLSYRQRSSCFQLLLANRKKTYLLFFIFMITGFWNAMFADGSKDFYPSGATGNRAFLYSNAYESGGTTIRSWPFKTLGTHYVYAKVGETIAAASSAQGVTNGRIRLTAPDGTVYLSANNAVGRIANRAEELAGPLYSGQATGANRYQPFTTVVAAGEEGIWKVEFLPSGSETSSSTPGVTDIAADANWTQGTNTELIAAWDVSVRNSTNTAWLNGRVYTNILNLHISGSSFLANKAFYGNMYVLTRDGIAYRVTNNGSNGVGFTFFVNNKGFLTATGDPSYKSLNISDPTDAQFRIHDPRSQDSGSNVTHKIFYSKPAVDLPSSASISGGTTWLKNAVLTPTASNITYTGVEGTPDLSGNKGAYIGFDSNLAGTYRIEIIGGFPTRVINGNCIVGTNTVYWDGRDGSGNILPAGTNIGEIRVQLFGAEVHFPFIDMEINPGGIIIEQLDNSYNVYSPTKDLVYWDDTDVTGGMATHRSNPLASGNAGISSNTNGHKWGLYTSGSSGSGNSGTGSSSFGNEKSMDTWSFVPGEVIVKTLDVVVAAADLEVVSVVPSTTTVIAGQNMSYTVTVNNNGPSAVTGAGFNFIVPAGFTINTVTYVNSQGTVVVVNGTIDPVTGNYTANLDMTNGGQVVFTINGTVSPTAGGQPLTVEASIIRPADVTDPDATNPGTNPPTDPHLECLNGTAVENCNNIKYNTITPIVAADLAVTKTASNMTPSVGDQITFTITATNNGAGNATGVQVVEQLPTGYTYVSSTTTAGTFNHVAGLWTIGNLTNGQSQTLTVTVTVNATGIYTNNAIVSGNENDPNPTNNTATSTPTRAISVVVAENDSATNINGTTGATNVVNVYTNDTLNGTAVVPSEVILTTTVPNPNLVLNPNGNIDVIPGTPAGTYTLTYQICEVLNPTNCDTAVVSVTVVAPVINAENDSATNINGTTGATNVVNVYTNDTLNGTAVVPSEVILTTTVPNPNLVLNPNGNIDVIPGTPAGTYTLTYQICEVLNPTNCDTAVVSVTVVAPVINAENDSATNINGTTGATNVVNVYTNDTLNGTAVVPSEVILTTTVPNPNLVLNPNGNIDVIPGTPAGTYTLTYQICEVLNPTNCDTAVVSVTVVAPVINAENDSATNINGTTGATNVVNVYTNDTLNGTAVVPSEVILTTTVPNPNLVLNPNGNIDVIPGTPAGTYTLTYQICEVLNPTNCDTAVVSVTVVAPVINAENDSATNINGTTGATNVVNVYTNDTLNGTAVVPSEVILTTTVPNPNLVLNPNGNVDVIPGTPAGTYTLTYQICEVLNPTNCDTAVVSVTVVAPVINAENDSATNINGTTGATNVVNVYTNDALNGIAVVPSEVILTTTVPNPNLVLNPNGNVDVIPGTPGGTYTLTYQICEVLNPTNCDTAVVSVTVVAPVINAENDSATNINGTTGATNVVNVYTNDTLNGIAVVPSEVILTTTVPNPNLVLNPNGNVDVIPGTPGGTYTLTYQICEVLNPTNCDTAVVTVFVMEPELTLTKDAISGTYDSVGDLIQYTLVVTNTGNVTVSNMTITDANADAGSISPATISTLAQGQSVTVTATHTVTQADLNNGFVRNLATVTGEDPNGGPVTDESEDPTNPSQPGNSGYDPTCPKCTITNLTQNPAIALVKTAVFNDTNADTYAQVGETITYTFTVTNTGNVTVNGLVINDALIGVANLSVNPAILAPGAIGTATATYTLTQADINNGQISNTAVASGTSPQGDPVEDTSGTSTTNDTPTVTTLPQNPAIALVKTAVFNDTNADTYAQVGETITYTFTVTNTGNVTVNGLVINDALIGVANLSVTPATLAPGAIGTATATYTLTQADINNGQISNTAVASGTSPQGDPVEDTSGTSTTNDTPTVTTLPQNPAIALVKTAVFNDTNADTYAQVGETITYTFTVTNTGNVTINGLVINDALIGVANLSVTPATLAPGAIGTATATYTLTQADINNGQISNTAVASGTSPQGDPVEDTSGTSTTNDTPTVTTLPQNPAIALVKTAVFNDINADTYAQVGETITYTFTVTNTGNVTVNGLVINDALIGVANLSVTPATLAPGAIGTATATYTLTQADVNNGQISNTAVASGTSPQGDPVEDTSGTSTTNDTPTVTTLPQNPAIALVKTAVFNDTNADTYAQVGETITYTFTVTNTGNVTVNGLVINDALIGVANLSVNPAILAPGAIGTATATYTLTQADINNGQISNTAVASGTSPQGDPVEDTSGTSTTNDTPTVTTLPQNPAIALVKTAVFNDTNADTYAQVGETITYTFTVTNTGNVTINGLVINDALIGVANLSVNPATLAPGAIGTATATYTLTQADINNGQISNTAVASGTSPQGDPVEDTSGTSTTNDTPTVTTLPQNPAIALVKTAVFNDTNADTYAQVGETITYTFTVTNTGNVTVNGLVINDALIGVANLSVTPATLAPGAIGTATATYTLTQADINNGQISNTAVASGTSPQGDPVEDTSGTSTTNDTPTVTTLPQNPAIALVKTAVFNDTNADTYAQVGETITYTFTVTNTGNVTVNGLVINDALIGVANLSVTPATLAPGAIGTATATYTLTQADINNGQISNTAVASGTSPQGDPVEDTSGTSTTNDTPTVTTLPQNPAIALVKTAVFNDTNADTYAQVGETITYTFTVTNTGNVTVNGLVINDALIGVANLSVTPATLAPGAIGTATATYTLTQADVNNGQISNTAVASGTSPQGDPVEDTSGTSTTNDTPTVTTLPQNPAIALVKTAVFNDTNADTYAQVGETITYTFTVTNTGNVTVNGLVINDALIGVANLSVNPVILAPGAIGTATATYTLTQADINNGQISNTAVASGTSPQGDPVEDTSGTSTTNDTPTVTTLPQNPAIALVKTAVFNDTNADTYAQVGETITYTFTVTNTGNVTVNGLVINDALIGVANLSVNPAILAPGAIGTATATYTLTQADINNGQISNTAVASGTSPQGDPVEDTSGTSTTNDTPTVTTLPQNPAIALVKTAVFNDTNADTYAQVGETITYTFTVTNTGNVTVNGLVINDALIGVANLSVTPATLAPGAIGTATATYTLTQADINNGQISNTAVASGTSPQGDPVEDTSGTSTTNDTPTVTILPQNPQLALYKDGTYQDTNGDGVVNAGDTIAYTFTVSNTGNVTITNITISDPIVTVTGGPLSSLEPGMTNSTTFTAMYTITQADIDEGAVYNLAFVEGTAPDGSTVVDDSEDPTPIDPNDPLIDPACPDCTVTPLIQTPSIALIKTGVFNDNNHDGIAQAGETITYSFTVTNTGNTSLSNVTITDPLPGVVVTGGPINLAVGASDSTTFTAVYVITQADIIAGSVSNQAFVNGTSPQGEVVTDSSDDHDLVGNNPTVITVNGCTINVFNAVSPNGDGSNDILYIAGIECYPNNEVLIFNRWGVQVFETKGYNNNDKVFKGYSDGRATISSSEPLPDGTYFYILKYTTADGATQEKNGYLYITR
ncbi:DUF7507 domain-containing protein [Flavobacterium cerinum]|uniref:Gliding motility-associated C-terminal domain-containing protein n=1 Tax=Flavobacterium cerinum TaxID=2502784 RepID=A0ABY5INR4_9FLAO|nr:gliding motility-associated C-terminal domain-containing protein [Flavobacterium cerinum]UUC43865.1 gliding motility-associated C-terminal domain-containing protein [Flavobacterium cerinum]